jgi:Conserved hypothetical protein 2217 (DUF2460)
MLTFPTLKTGSAAQYPLKVAETFSNEVLQFMGGDEQRYRISAGMLRSWTIQLDLLDERELSDIEDFFVAASGSATSFAFTDPADGVVYSNCYIESDDLTDIFSGDLRAGTVLVIREGRA